MYSMQLWMCMCVWRLCIVWFNVRFHTNLLHYCFRAQPLFWTWSEVFFDVEFVYFVFCCWAFCCRSSSVAVVVWDYCCGGFVGSSRDCFAFRAVFFGISSGDSQPFYLAYLLLLLRPGYGLDDWTWSWAEWMYSQFVFVFICCFVFHAFIYL